MEQRIAEKICKEVYKNFPEMSGKAPTQKPHGAGQTLFIFKGEAKVPGGRTMDRTVRVVADEQGNIIKMTTSR